MQQLIKATRTEVHRRGDQRRHRRRRQRLRRPRQGARGTDTEINADTVTDWTDLDFGGFQKASSTLIDDLLGYLDGRRRCSSATRPRSPRSGRSPRANQYVERPSTVSSTPTAADHMRSGYGNTMLVDPARRPAANPIIPVETRDPDNTVYTVTVTGSPTGGTFKLTSHVDGDTRRPAAIAYNASAATVQAAIEALSNVPAAASPSPARRARTRSPSPVRSPTQVVTVALGRTTSPAARPRR
jgi:hypothetical protein